LTGILVHHRPLDLGLNFPISYMDVSYVTSGVGGFPLIGESLNVEDFPPYHKPIRQSMARGCLNHMVRRDRNKQNTMEIPLGHAALTDLCQ
jgi:hypothetical protein